MEANYIRFYEWYRSKNFLKNMTATVMMLFSYVLYYTFFHALTPPVAWKSGSLSLFSSKLEEISSYLLVNLFMCAPYIMIVFFLIIFTLYKSIVLKIMMAVICLIGLMIQLAVLMGFTSYWDFLYFLPQLILLIIVGKIIFRTREITKCL